jgi:molybdopterin-biosynthesis enzyme MoeA-like protein
MPKAYEAMKRKFRKAGMNMKAAKRKAARIYNSKHPKRPVTRRRHG